MKRTLPILTVVLLAEAGGCKQCPPPTPPEKAPRASLSVEERRRHYEEAVAAPSDKDKFEAYLGSLAKFDDRYVVEGDLMATREEVRALLVLAGLPRGPPSAAKGVSPADVEIRPAPLKHAPAPGAAPAGALEIAKPPVAPIRLAVPERIDLAAAFLAKALVFTGPEERGRKVIKLKGEVEGGTIVHWGDPSQRTFAARVDAASFEGFRRSPMQIATELAEAGLGWQQVCSDCGVRFSVGDAPLGAVAFTVRYWPKDVNGALAIAFMPRAPSDQRVLWILPPFYALGDGANGAERVKVLKHELGHILGYLHEQVGTATVCGERTPSEWTRIDKDHPNDPDSVMYYFCGKTDSRNDFSPLDRAQHRQVYRP